MYTSRWAAEELPVMGGGGSSAHEGVGSIRQQVTRELEHKTQRGPVLPPDRCHEKTCETSRASDDSGLFKGHESTIFIDGFEGTAT